MDKFRATRSRLGRLILATVLGGMMLACDGSQQVTGRDDSQSAPHGLRLSLAGNVIAAPGAVFEAQVVYVAPTNTRTVLATESVTINTGGTPTTLSLSADVSACLRDAAAQGDASCRLELTTRLKRDGALLDESVQQLTVNATTERIDAQAVQLFEVNTVTIAPTAITNLEPGESLTLTAVATDKQSRVVTGRSLTWERVSGGITIGNDGVLQAQTAGAARVRATMGGRSAELAFDVRQTSVASLQILPADTSAVSGTAFTYRVTARSAAGAVLTGRTINFSSSNVQVASVSALGVATANLVGTTTITASSPDGRNGAIISAATALTVLPRPSIVLSPLTLSFDTEIGQPMPLAQTVNVTNGGAGSLGTLTIDSIGAGLSATLSTSAAPSVVTIRPTVAVAPGTSVTRIVRIKSSTVGVSDGVVTVTIVGKQPPPILVSTAFVTLDSVIIGGITPAVNVAVTTAAGRVLTGLTASIAYAQSGSTWLTATLSPTSTATTLVLRGTAGTLPVGTYTADVTLASANPHIPAVVRVTMKVVGLPRVVLNPKSVSFGPMDPNISSVPTASVTVQSAFPPQLAGLTAQIQYIGSGSGWLVATLQGLTTPTTLLLTPRPIGLLDGTYQARVIVATTALGAGPDTVSVQLIVRAEVVWAQVATGDAHTCGRSNFGVVFCWGRNTSGQLGNGTLTNSTVPVKVSGSLTFADISATGNHTCGRTSAGGVQCWGQNTEGQLGNGSLVNSLIPVGVSGSLVYAEVKAGWRHTCGRTTGGVLYCWGNNTRGQLGIGSTTRSTVPVLVSQLPQVIDVNVGIDFTCARNTFTDVFCWGANDLGQLGYGTGLDKLLPYRITYEGGPTAVALGGFHGCWLWSGGIAECWGNNYWGQLGRGPNGSNDPYPYPVFGTLTFTQLIGGYGHACGRTSLSQLYCWGDNAAGQLGVGSIGSFRLEPTLVQTSVQFFEVKAGGAHTCARTIAGVIYCTGENIYGQLGIGTTTNTGTLTRVVTTFPFISSASVSSDCGAFDPACLQKTHDYPTEKARIRPPPVPQSTGKPPRR